MAKEAEREPQGPLGGREPEDRPDFRGRFGSGYETVTGLSGAVTRHEDLAARFWLLSSVVWFVDVGRFPLRAGDSIASNYGKGGAGMRRRGTPSLALWVGVERMRRQTRLRVMLAMSATGAVGALLAVLLMPGPRLSAAGGGGTALTVSGTQAQVPAVFAQNCADCHGMDASGSGPEHSDYDPPPANLTLIRDTTPMVTSIVAKGIQGTAMHPNPRVTAAQAQEILTFVTSAAVNMQRQWEWPYQATKRDAIPPDMGRTIYITTCVGCHGEDGTGAPDGLEDPHVWPKPADLTARSSQLGRLYYIISEGVPGTMMPPQKYKFQSELARFALAEYVAGLYDPNSTATIQTGKMEAYRNPYKPTNNQVVQRGRTVTSYYCGYCHGGDMAGTFLAPNLIDREWYYGGGTDNALWMVIKDGIPGKLMPPHTPLPERDRWAAITFIRWQGGDPDPRAGKTESEGR